MNEPSAPNVYAYMNQRLVPYGVSLEVTAACNIDCVHCYHVACREEELSTDEIRRVLDDLARLGSLELTLTGGEPLLRPDFQEILRYAVLTAGYSVKIFSNLTLLTPALADLMASLPLNTVETTLLGADADVHDSIAGRAGAFDALIRAIRLLKGKGIPVSAKTIVMEPNRRSLDAMYELAGELDIPFRHDDCVFVESSGSRRPLSLQLSDGEVSRLRKRTGLPVVPEAALCNIAKSVLSIAPDGAVYPCGPFPDTAGSIRETPIAEIWRESPIFRLLRAVRYEDYDLCRECRYLIRCGGCVAMGIGLSAGRTIPCRIARRRLRYLT